MEIIEECSYCGSEDHEDGACQPWYEEETFQEELSHALEEFDCKCKAFKITEKGIIQVSDCYCGSSVRPVHR